MLAGGINTFFSFSVYSMAIFAQTTTALALLIAMLSGTVFNFFTTGGYVFRDLSPVRFPSFLISYVLIYAINLQLLNALSVFVNNKIICQAIAAGPMALLSYFLMSKIVFLPIKLLKNPIAKKLSFPKSSNHEKDGSLLIMNKVEINNNKNMPLTIGLFLLLFIITIFPLLKFKYPILIDYPNHLAGYFIQANIDNDVWLKENYKIEWHIKPYLIIEWLGGILAQYMDIYTAGKMVLMLGIFFICAGALFIRKAVSGYIDLWMVTAFVFIYNYILFYGFVNYYVGAGFALISMGGWIKLRKTHAFVNVMLFSILSTFLFLCHLFALFIYAVFVISYELGMYKYSKEKYVFYNLIKAVAQFIFPLILFLSFHDNGYDIYVGDIYRYGNFYEKVAALLSPIMFYDDKYSLYVIEVVVILLLVIRLFFRSDIKIHDNMKLPLLSFLFLSVITPSFLAGVWGLDFRFPFVLMILLVVSVQFDNNKNSMNFVRSVVLISIALACFKIYLINDRWEKIGLQYQEFENSLQNIELGAKVLTIQKNSKNITATDNSLYHHISALAVIERSCFWPNLFTSYLTPVYPTEKTKHIDPISSVQLSLEDLLNKNALNGEFYNKGIVVYWENWTQDFDYLIALRFEDLSVIDIKNLKLKFRGSFFDIYQIVH
ncbi:MAG: GtrA family protein [Mucilaginibacter sp.]